METWAVVYRRIGLPEVTVYRDFPCGVGRKKNLRHLSSEKFISSLLSMDLLPSIKYLFFSGSFTIFSVYGSAKLRNVELQLFHCGR